MSPLLPQKEHLVSYWQCYTECDMWLGDVGQRWTFRAHPNYQNDGPFYDWAYINFDGNLYPCKIVTFVLNKATGNRYALVHACEEQDAGNLDSCGFQNSLLFSHWALEYDREKSASGEIIYRSKLRLVLVESISSVCYAFEDVSGIQESYSNQENSYAGEDPNLVSLEEAPFYWRSHKHVVAVCPYSEWKDKFWGWK